MKKSELTEGRGEVISQSEFKLLISKIFRYKYSIYNILSLALNNGIIRIISMSLIEMIIYLRNSKIIINMEFNDFLVWMFINIFN